MTGTPHNPPNGWVERHEASLSWLLVVSGLFGATFGAVTATWQVSIETSQVLLGMVDFDRASLPYAYHVSTLSLINYIGCVFLALTRSEALSSILLASFIGAVSLQALALTIHFVLRNAHYAALIAILLSGIDYFGVGISYPILFMRTEHTYGPAGLIVVIYAMALLGLARYRSGLFLCGLALCVHPLWGLWLNGCLMLALMWSRRDLNAIIRRREIVCYVAGLSPMFAMIAWQKLNFPSDLGVVVSSAEEVRSIFLGYIRHWDHHRQRFDDPRLLVPGFLYALLALFFAVRFRKGCADPGGRLFLSIAAVSAILSIPLVFIPSWFDPALFPEKLIVAMPGRFINVAIFLATPLWIAKVIAVLRERNAYLLLVLVMGALLVVSVHGVSGHPVKQVMWLLLGLAVVAVLVFGRRPERLGGRASRSVDRASAALGPSFNKIVLYACGLAMCVLPATYLSRNKAAIERRFERLTIPAGVQGSILVTFERWLLQLEVRHATLVPHIDGYAYLGPSALLALNSLTTDVFGISMKNEPARSMALHTSILWTRDYKVLWEGRTCQEWEGLAGKYKFGLVVVPGDLVLQLPRADDDRAWGKYLPKCTS